MAELSPEREAELNRKMLEFAGFSFPTLTQTSDGRKWYYPSPDDPDVPTTAIRPDGMAISSGDLPNFPNDMNSCLELIVPKLQSFVIGTYHEDGYLVPQGFYAQVENGLHNGFARGETVPLALCLAVEKMIDSRSGSSYLNARGVLPQGGMSDEEAMRRCRGE